MKTRFNRMQQIGRYRILGEIGRGAMGVVYKAEDPAIGRIVAIKTIRLTDVDDPKERAFLRDRLFREARSAGILSHPGIVTIYDVQEHEGIGYVFMEYVDGPSLEALMQAPEPLSKESIVRILLQTAAALDYAHAKGIVHRDIKPANILVASGDAAKITDFGIAKFTSAHATQTGMVLGTPSYMSPEQIADKKIDGRSDQFALSVIAYFLLTGEKPFSGGTLPSLMFKIVNEDPLPVQRLNPTLGKTIDAVIQKGLHKTPEGRYPNSTEFAKALVAACAKHARWQPMRPGAAESLDTVADSLEQKPPEPRRTGEPAALEQSAKPTPPPPAPPRRFGEAQAKPRRWPAKAAFVAGFLVVVLGAYLGIEFLGRKDTPTPPIEKQQATPPAQETRPSAMGPPASPPPGAPGSVTETTSPETKAPPQLGQSSEPAPPPPGARETGPPGPPVESAEPRKPPTTRPAIAGPADGAIRVTTSPPAAKIVFDGNPQVVCTTPCEMPLTGGRHTLVASLDGHRTQSRILQIPSDKELVIVLDRSRGTLLVRSIPPGAAILLNGEERKEKTPAMLTLPIGKYKLQLVKEGFRREDRDIEIKDGAVTNLDVVWSEGN
jgi:serine/threonine-protein kinase